VTSLANERAVCAHRCGPGVRPTAAL